MKKRLYINALLTSPLIAVYGVSPFYIFEKVSFYDVSRMAIGLTVLMLVFWGINIFLLHKITEEKNLLRYILSFSIVFFIQILFKFLGQFTQTVTVVSETGNKYFIYPLIVTFAINTIILIICHSITLEKKKKDADNEIEQLKIGQLEAEKQMLIQQLQPHFLFNSPSVLKSLIQDDKAEAENYTMKLSDFLRYSVQSHNKDVVTLAEELQFTNDYIELQKVRFDDSFNCKIDLPNEILTQQMPVYALQTLVENAFKHNYFTAKKPLNIHIFYENDKIVVSNNKILNSMSEKMGTGLANLNRRYELILGKDIEVLETEQSFRVTIPLIWIQYL